MYRVKRKSTHVVVDEKGRVLYRLNQGDVLEVISEHPVESNYFSTTYQKVKIGDVVGFIVPGSLFFPDGLLEKI